MAIRQPGSECGQPLPAIDDDPLRRVPAQRLEQYERPDSVPLRNLDLLRARLPRFDDSAPFV